jgi:hypothetical protein
MSTYFLFNEIVLIRGLTNYIALRKYSCYYQDNLGFIVVQVRSFYRERKAYIL